MGSTAKIPTSFRLNAEFVASLRESARLANRSLNNYVESVLMNVVYREHNPNVETKEAIAEADEIRKKYLKGEVTPIQVDLSNVDSMLKSIGV